MSLETNYKITSAKTTHTGQTFSIYRLHPFANKTTIIVNLPIGLKLHVVNFTASLAKDLFHSNWPWVRSELYANITLIRLLQYQVWTMHLGIFICSLRVWKWYWHGHFGKLITFSGGWQLIGIFKAMNANANGYWGMVYGTCAFESLMFQYAF